MKRQFTKMHGCGNDYIYFNCFNDELENPQELSIILSDRHKGIGGDGIVLICKSHVADAKMRMFNLDGSEGKMCGNAIRCVGKYLYDNGIVSKETLQIETLSGIKTLKLHCSQGKVQSVTVEMGQPEFSSGSIPALIEKERVIGYPLEVAGRNYIVTCVSMGNPHCVIFTKDVEQLALDKLGPPFERHPLFPEGINIEFVECISPTLLRMRVWERGSGETMACGTGACATVAAAIVNGLCEMNTDIIVRLNGGELTIRQTDTGITMTGAAETVFEGEVIV